MSSAGLPRLAPSIAGRYQGHCIDRTALLEPANSVDIKVHYSFDYAQQVHYPSNPLQPGPIYFLTPRKCTVFGVNCEALPWQINFLTDEAGECGKGANAVVSRIHFFFEKHGFREKEVYLHADNCTGQNKNNCMIQYLVWRTLTDRHTTITSLSLFFLSGTQTFPRTGALACSNASIGGQRWGACEL